MRSCGERLMRVFLASRRGMLVANIAVAVVFVAVTVAMRGLTLQVWHPFNADEAELMAQAHAAERSILPFTTWTMGTTGPVWPMFLAVLGHFGYPLTIASAHLLAAILTGIMGFLVWILMRRVLGNAMGLWVAVMMWLPLALIYPVGPWADFGALTTELLPCVLVLSAALFRPASLALRPWLFAPVGLLCGLAVGSKYQVVPVAGALLIAQLIATHQSRPRTLLASAWWVAGAATPFAIIAIALVISPSVSLDLVRQNLSFLFAYAGKLDFRSRVANFAWQFSRQLYVVLVLILLARLSALSSRRVVITRIGLALSGFVAVAAGGMRFPHYLWLLYIALVLAAAQPMREGAVLLPWAGVRRARRASAAAAIVGLLGVIVFGIASDRLVFAGSGTVRASLSVDSVNRDPFVAAECPAGSHVLVWGWAAELYVYYSWENTVPFMNTLGLRSTPENLSAVRPIVSKGIANANCVVDASGSPFFGANKAASLELVYPEFTVVLSKEFTKRRGVLNCPSCTFYVRN